MVPEKESFPFEKEICPVPGPGTDTNAFLKEFILPFELTRMLANCRVKPNQFTNESTETLNSANHFRINFHSELSI